MIFCATTPALSWGRMGHDAIAYIAENHLKKSTQKHIARYLDHPIVYYATWMDDYRATAPYAFTTHWHTGSVDAAFNSTAQSRIEGRDCVEAIEQAIAKLQHYKTLDDSTVVVNLKYIIHLAGDMHCPSHVHYPNTHSFDVKYKGYTLSYHSVWDSAVLGATQVWSASDYPALLDHCTSDTICTICAGTPADWFHETAVACRPIYDWATPGSTLNKDFFNRSRTLCEAQILKAGLRLAYLLNTLFE